MYLFGKSRKAIDKVPNGIMNERRKRVPESSEFIFIKVPNSKSRIDSTAENLLHYEIRTLGND